MHAVKEVQRSEVQVLMDKVKGLIEKATMGYALMTVMDDTDLGKGLNMKRQMVNLHSISDTFMSSFITGVKQFGLHNRIVETAIDVGVH